MKRLGSLVTGILFIINAHAQVSVDSSSHKNFRVATSIDFMGIGYHGYDFPSGNFGLTLSGEFVFAPIARPLLQPYLLLGLGTTMIHPLGFATFSSGILIGKNVSFCRIGIAVAVAFTEDVIQWNRGVHNGGGGIEVISWGAQAIPILGYTYLSYERGLTASIYASPHFALPTYHMPGPVESDFWISGGISVGYLF